MTVEPITVAIERRVDPDRIAEVTIWTQAGTDLASRQPGYLGSGFVRAGADSDVWYMLYRFADTDSLAAWEGSRERAWWLESGRDLAKESRVERRTGIEGWFDAAYAQVLDPDVAPAPAPPRWKQAVSIWLGFFPVNLVFTVLATALVPGFSRLWLPLRVLVTTLALTPPMTYWVLPLVTRWLRPWLLRR
ncbi:MAG: antibiotic biosynthesis monooxygenase [Friedmanniella sp.]|nr:antibiotic biosynthesis monooxygenase [Friedmanniella sp.]